MARLKALSQDSMQHQGDEADGRMGTDALRQTKAMAYPAWESP